MISCTVPSTGACKDHALAPPPGLHQLLLQGGDPLLDLDLFPAELLLELGLQAPPLLLHALDASSAAGNALRLFLVLPAHSQHLLAHLEEADARHHPLADEMSRRIVTFFEQLENLSEHAPAEFRRGELGPGEVDLSFNPRPLCPMLLDQRAEICAMGERPALRTSGKRREIDLLALPERGNHPQAVHSGILELDLEAAQIRLDLRGIQEHHRLSGRDSRTLFHQYPPHDTVLARLYLLDPSRRDQPAGRRRHHVDLRGGSPGQRDDAERDGNGQHPPDRIGAANCRHDRHGTLAHLPAIPSCDASSLAG